MNKSLDKSLAILEFVINKGGIPATPSEIAKNLGLNAPTCIRILNGFASNGYIVQKSRREGYVPGPAVFALSGNNCFYSKIIKASSQTVKEIALKLNRLVLVSTCRGGRKFILNHFNGSSNSAHFLSSSYNDFYYTVSGRALLANLSDGDLNEYIKSNGLPGDLWDGIDSLDALKKELDTIKHQDHFLFNDNGEYWGICVPLPFRDVPFTVISSSVLKEEETANALELLQDGAARISESIKQESPTAY